MVFPRVQCWGQLCVISLQINLLTRSRMPSMNLQLTSHWAGVLICWRGSEGSAEGYGQATSMD